MPLLAAVFANADRPEESRAALETAHLEVQRLKEQLQVENVQLRREVKV